MKAAKKLTALVLALMMSLSIMAVPAAAYGDDVIMPRGPAKRCPVCDAPMEEVKRGRDENNKIYSVLECVTPGCANEGWQVTVYW